MKKIFIAILLFSIVPFSYCQEQSLKHQKIKQLLSITGDNDRYMKMLGSIADALSKSDSRIDKEKMMEIINRIDITEMRELYIPIYEKYYTVEDIDQLIAFYETPVGKKTLAILPQIMQESLDVVMQWGKQKFQEIIRQMKIENQNKL